jgi:hypothetical protein
MNELSFSASLSANKHGAVVGRSFNGSLSMTGDHMLQKTVTVGTAVEQLEFDDIGQNLNKLLIANLDPATYPGVSAVAINATGTGYTANDVVTLVGGDGIGATVRINTVDGSGHVTGVTVLTNGKYFSTTPPSSGCAVTGGTGTGLTLNLTFSSYNGNTVSIASNNLMQNTQDVIRPGDFILRSPPAANYYMQAANAAVNILVIAVQT